MGSGWNDYEVVKGVITSYSIHYTKLYELYVLSTTTAESSESVLRSIMMCADYVFDLAFDLALDYFVSYNFV